MARDRGSGYAPGVFERYKRVHELVDEGIKEMFLRGVSTRKVGQVLNALSGSDVSAGYVSRVTKELDWEVRRFENEPVNDDYALLFLDALNVKIRYELRAKRQMVPIAYGIRRDGGRRLISFREARSWARIIERRCGTGPMESQLRDSTT